MTEAKQFAKRMRSQLRSRSYAAVVAHPFNPNEGELTSARTRQHFVAQDGLDGLGTISPDEIEQAAELNEVLSAAKTHNIRVIFVVMPRSASAATAAGEKFEREYAANLRTFAERFDVEVWRPAISWDDGFFYDRSHANRRGRRRFVEALRRKLDSIAPEP